MTDKALLERLLRSVSRPEAEGSRPYIYQDSRGIPTLGVGLALIVDMDSSAKGVNFEIRKDAAEILQKAGLPPSEIASATKELNSIAVNLNGGRIPVDIPDAYGRYPKLDAAGNVLKNGENPVFGKNPPPYVDKDGNPLRDEGGSVVYRESEWHSPTQSEHAWNGVVMNDSQSLTVFEFKAPEYINIAKRYVDNWDEIKDSPAGEAFFELAWRSPVYIKNVAAAYNAGDRIGTAVKLLYETNSNNTAHDAARNIDAIQKLGVLTGSTDLFVGSSVHNYFSDPNKFLNAASAVNKVLVRSGGKNVTAEEIETRIEADFTKASGQDIDISPPGNLRIEGKTLILDVYGDCTFKSFSKKISSELFSNGQNQFAFLNDPQSDQPAPGIGQPNVSRRIEIEETAAGDSITRDVVTIQGEDGKLHEYSEITYKGYTIVKSENGGTIYAGDDIISKADSDGELNLTLRKMFPDQAPSVYGAEIGSTLGSTLGHYLGGDNPFAQVGTSAILSAFGKNLGETIDWMGQGADLSQAIDRAFLGHELHGAGAFSEDLLASAKSAAIGAVSALLVSELSHAIGLDHAGIAGQFIDAGLNGAANLIGTNALEMAFGNGTSLFTNLDQYFDLSLFTESAQATEGAAAGSVTASFAGAAGSFLGSMLANEVVPVTSTEGAIGSGIGGAVGAYVGQVLIPVPFVGAFVGSFVGSALGGLLGGLFGGGHHGTVEAIATVGFDGEHFVVTGSHAANGGDVGLALSMAGQAASTLNAVLAAAGGTVIDPEKLSGFRYGQYDTHYEAGGETTQDPQAGLEKSMARILKQVEFEGADPFVVRAIQRSDAETVQQLMGEIQIAKDYENYLDNREEINALIAANPDSAFAVGWALTLTEARRLELDKPHPAEFLSRLDKEIVEQGVDLAGHTIRDAVMELKDGVLTIAFRDPDHPDQKFADMQPRLVIDDWAGWSKDTARIQLDDGSAYGLGGLMERFGITDGGGPAALADAMAALADGADVDAVWAGGFTNDILVGGDGNDLLDGGAGNDTLRCGAGDDILIGGAGADSLDGGAGMDTASYAGSAEGVDVDLALGYGQGGDADHDRLVSIENVVGSAHDDVLSGDSGANVLAGGDGNDVIEGRGGADTLDGGTGTDTLSYADSLGGVNVDLAAGTTHGGDAEGDVFTSFENITGGIYDDVLTGDTGANTLRGGAGADTLAGGAGADTLVGGEGFDTADYSASGAGVRVDLAAGTGTGGDAEGDRLSGIERVVGSAHDDVLSAGAGDQVLEGGAANDTLSGGAGADTLLGGDGTDTASYADATAAISVALDRGDGRSSTSRGDAAGDVLSGMENLRGGAGDDRLAGDAGANTLVGGAGNDSLAGGAGDDVLEGGAGADLIMGGDGIDTAVFSGNAEDYVIEADDQGRAFVRSLLGETDTLTGIEFIRFDNKLVDVADIRMAEASRRALDEGDEDEEERGTTGQRAASTSAEMMARAAMIGLAMAALTSESSALTLNPLAGEPTPAPEMPPAVADAAIASAFVGQASADVTVAAPAAPPPPATVTTAPTSMLPVDDPPVVPSPITVSATATAFPDMVVVPQPPEAPVAPQVATRPVVEEAVPTMVTAASDPAYVSTTEVPMIESAADTPALSVVDVVRLEDETIPLDIRAWSTDPDGSETVSVLIDGLPSGAVLSAGLLQPTGKWLLNPAELTGLTLTLPADLAGTFELTVTATSTEWSGQTATTSQKLTVTVIAQADDPTLTVADVGRLEDQVIPLTIASQSTDADGSETVTVRVEGLPAGGTLNAGTQIAPGIWTLVPADLAGLSLTLPADMAGEFDLAVYSTATEANGDAATVSQVLHISVTPQADVPDLSASAAPRLEDQRVSLDILTASTDDDGSETVTIRIEGVPSGATLSAGTHTGAGVWDLTPAQLAGLTMDLPRDMAEDFVLRVISTATEPNADAVSTLRLLPIVLTAQADTPDLGVTAEAGAISGTTADQTLTAPPGGATLLGGGGKDVLTGGSGADRLEGDTASGLAQAALSITAVSTDTSGREQVFVTVFGVPDGGRLSAGTELSTADGTPPGTWVLSSAQLVGLSVFVPAGTSDYTLYAVATAVDTDPDTGVQDALPGEPQMIVVRASDVGGADTLDGGVGDDVLLGGVGDDTLIGGAGADQLFGGSGNDLLYIDAADTVINGGSGVDTMRVQGTQGVTLDLAQAGVEIAYGGDGADRFTAGSGAVTVDGGAGNDILLGGSGNDTLVGGAGSDVLFGGAGDDRLVMDADDDPAFIDGGDGFDTIVIEGTRGVSLDVVTAHAELVIGGDGTDSFFNSGSQNTTVLAGAGDDVVFSGGGADVLDGGSGSDTLSYALSAAGVTVDLATGSASGGSAEGDVISGFENLVGSAHDDHLTGDSKGNVLAGGRGNDVLIGGGGRDVFRVTVDPQGGRSDVTVIRDFRPSDGTLLSLDGVVRGDAVAAMTYAIATQEMAPSGDVTLSFPDGSKVVLEGLGRAFTADMTDVAVVQVADAFVTEDVGTATIQVGLSRPVDFDVTVDWLTQPGSATGGADYTGGGGRLTIPAGQSAQISVPIANDRVMEDIETVALKVTGIGDASGVRSLDYGSAALDIIDGGTASNQADPTSAGIAAVQMKTITVTADPYNFGVMFTQSWSTKHPYNPNYIVQEQRVDIEAGGASSVSLDYNVLLVNSYRYFRADFQWFYRVDSGYGWGSWRSAGSLGSYGGEYVGSYSRSGHYTISFGETLPEGAVVEVRGGFYLNELSGGGQCGGGHIQLTNLQTNISQDTEAFALGDVNGDGLEDLIYYDYLRKLNVVRFGNGANGGFDGALIANDLGSEGFAHAAGGDFNGDHRSDLAMAEGNRVVWLSGTEAVSGNLSASSLASVVANNTVMMLQAANFNGDAFSDLMVATGTNGHLSDVYLLWGGGAGLTTGSLAAMTTAQVGHLVLAAGVWDQAIALEDLDGDNIADLGLVRDGSVDVVASGDVPFATGQYDTIHLGGVGNDTLAGGTGRDWMSGGGGNDTLLGNAGDDLLMGGAGNDVLQGGGGNDTYVFSLGDGQDIIRNGAVDEAAETDVLQLGAGIRREDLWLERIGDDLRLSVLGTHDSITVGDWFANPAARLDVIETAAGDRLADDMVSDLVQAMAFQAKPEETFHSAMETPADLLAALDLAWDEHH